MNGKEIDLGDENKDINVKGGHVFQNKTRAKENINEKIWYSYCFGKQSYKELSIQYNCSTRTIQKILDSSEFIEAQFQPRKIILLMDTIYFGDFGIIIFQDYESKKVIRFRLVKNENNTDYKTGVEILQKEGWIIQAIVCDGRKWLLTGFPHIPTQMCNFHQVAIIRRYVTKKPVLEANKALKWLSELLVHTDKETFSYYLDLFGEVYREFLNEKTQDKNGKMALYS